MGAVATCAYGHLPADDAAPLVQLDGEVSVRLDPVGVRRIHRRLARGTDRHGLLDLGVAELRDHGQLRGEVAEVVGLLLHVALGDEHGEVAILNPHLLNLGVEPPLDELPNPVGPWPQNEATLDRILLDQLRL